MESNNKGFVVYGDIEAVINELDDVQAGQIFRAMIAYHNTGDVPELSNVLKLVFIPIRQQMDRDTKKYNDKREKLKKNASKRWENDVDSNAIACNCMQMDAIGGITTTITNTNTITKTNTTTMSPDGDVWALSSSVISHLNDVAGTNYKPDEAETARLIAELAQKGYTEEQMKSVIDKKAASWLGDPIVEQYLRPRTLFKMSNFENYVNEPDTARQKKKAEERKRRDKAATNGRRLKDAEAELSDVREQIRGLPSVRGDPEAFNTRARLKDREAFLESEIKKLKRG